MNTSVWVEISDAFVTKVEMKGDVQTYAMNFLHIFNNVRTQEALLAVENDYEDGVYLYWKEEDGVTEETVTRYLSQFGEVAWTDNVRTFRIDDYKVEDYNYDMYYTTLVVGGSV